MTMDVVSKTVEGALKTAGLMAISETASVLADNSRREMDKPIERIRNRWGVSSKEEPNI